MRITTRRQRHFAWSRAIAGGVAVAVIGLTSAFGLSLSSSALADGERVQGEWRVVPLGADAFYFYIDGQNRLSLRATGKPLELWDTQAGKRIAVLTQVDCLIGAVASSPDGKKFLLAEALPEFYEIAETKTVRSIWIYETSTGKFLKRIDVDLSAAHVRGSTEWRFTWRTERELFVQFNRRDNATRACAESVFAWIDSEKGRVQKLSDELEIPEHLILSPDGKRAMATMEYGVYRGEDGGIGVSGRGHTSTVELVDMQAFRIICHLDDAKWEHFVEPRRSLRRRLGRPQWQADKRAPRTRRLDSEHLLLARRQPNTHRER